MAPASPPPSRPINDGSAFDPETGKLFRFDAGEPSSIEVMRLWPDPRAWRRLDGGFWRGWRPLIDLGEPARASRRRGRPLRRRWLQNLGSALERIPAAMRDRITPLPCPSHWRSLSMLARVPGADDLFDSNLALAVALAHPHCFRSPVRRPIDLARRLVRRRRVDALDWLGFPARRSTERILRRFHPDSINIGSLQSVRSLLRREPRTLQHLPALHWPLLHVLTNPRVRRRVQPRLLIELARLPPARAWRIANALQDIDVLLEQLERGAGPTLRELAQVDPVRDELLLARERLGGLRLVVRGLPPPPFERVRLDDLVIEPVRHVEQLAWLGAELRNCLEDPNQGYAASIGAGDGYLYSMKWGRGRKGALYLERGRLPESSWSVSDLKASCNKPAPPRVAEAVQAWLGDAHRKAGPWTLRYPSTVCWEPVPAVALARRRVPEPPDLRQLTLPLSWGGPDVPSFHPEAPAPF